MNSNKLISTKAALSKWVRDAAPGDRITYLPTLLAEVGLLSDAGRVLPFQQRVSGSARGFHYRMEKLSPEGASFINWLQRFA